MAGKTAGNIIVQEKDTEKTQGTEKLFSKEQLMASSRYMARRDILEALLEDEKEYSVNETDKIIGKFMKGKVI